MKTRKKDLPPKKTTDSILSGSELRLVAFWGLLLLAVKTYLAYGLGLYHDEAFYWQCAQQLALAYADHPFMTAFLVRAGTELFGNSSIGVRLFFLIMGSLLPVGAYLLARTRHEPGPALLASGCALFVPFVATLGLIAMPDVPLLFFALFGLLAFEKALDTEQLTPWIMTGLLAALGLATHYRFILFPAAAFIYLVGTSHGRSQWRKRGFWLSILIMMTGLLPVLLFNWSNQFEAINYQFSERQAWAFQPEGLRHPFEQMLVVTPLLYIGLIWALVIGIKKGFKGDHQAALFSTFAAFPLGIYLFLAPFSDRSHIFFHWPTLGYLPLFALLPDLFNRLKERFTLSGIRYSFLTAFILGGTLSLLLFIGVGASASRTTLNLAPSGSIAFELAGWKKLAEKTRAILEKLPENTVLAVDRYYVGAEIDFLLEDKKQLFLLNHPKNSEHGRALQYHLWQDDQKSMIKKAPDSVLIILQESDSDREDQFQQAKQLCKQFKNLVWQGRLDQFGAEKRYQFFSASLNSSEATEPDCPQLPSIGRLNKPRPHPNKKDHVLINGWTFNDGSGVAQVELLLDGEPLSKAQYGLKQAGLSGRFKGAQDPAIDDSGFSYQLDTSSLTKESYWLTARVTSNNGVITVLKPRRLKP